MRAHPLPAWAGPLALLLILALVRPRFFIGGGGDDWHYLEAARCAVQHGICLPVDHWSARFPLVLPMALSLAGLGESEWTVGLAPMLYAAAALILFVANVERRFGRPQAMMAGVALALTPLIPSSALQPMVDQPEFAWTMAALLAGQIALERPDARYAVLAGMALALAVMTRLTAVTLIPLLGMGWFLLDARRRLLALPFAVGLVLPLGGEMLAYAVATGDPFFGWKLALHHGRIPTTELPASVDLSRSPILNLDFIAHWRRSMGIHVHWTVDPLLNLIADPLVGLSLCGALALGVARWRDWRAEPGLRALAAVAGLHFLLLTYVLAIDPKPRMFLLELGVACTVLGVLSVRAWRGGGRLIVMVLFALLAMRGVLFAYDRVDMPRVRAVASRWVAEAPPDSLATDAWTRRSFALLPFVQALPLAEEAPRRTRLILAQSDCSGGMLAREARFVPVDWAPIVWLRAHHLLIGPQAPVRLCLIVPSRPLTR
jgi:4-amino-4-deoxy-L-arabinose transferase-like glycosyltransferase